MGSQVDKSFHLQDLPKLKEGERVEVRQKDVGLRGSWHPGTIVALKGGRCVVEYDELLTDDGIGKLREAIPCAKLIEKSTLLPGISTPQKNTALLATAIRSPSKRRGLLRPSPPTCPEPSPLIWKSGLFVDVFYEDAWWEAILLSDVISLDDDALVDVIYPDEGDLARVHAKYLRISQFWDEATGKWSVKGTTDLTKFLRRRGIGRKEVTSRVNSECKDNGQNSCPHSEMVVCEKEPIQMFPSSDCRYGDSPAAPLSVKDVNEESLPLPSHSNVVLESLSRDGDSSQHMQLTSSTGGDMVLDSSAPKDCPDTLTSPGRSEHVTHEALQNPRNVDLILDGNNDKNGNGSISEVTEREDAADCLPSPLVKEELIYDNLRSKRRRIDDACAISCEREAIYSCSQPTASSPLQNLCLPEKGQLETFKPICEEPSLGMEQSLDRGSTSYPGIGRKRGRSNLKGSRKRYPPRMFLEIATQQSFVSEESGLLRKKAQSPFSRSTIGLKRAHEKENNLCKQQLLLALEAPVRKSQEEYEQITSAGRAALENGVHNTATKPARQTGKKVPSWKARRQTPLAGKPAGVGGVHERAVRSGRLIKKVLPFEKLHEQRNQITSVGKAGLKESVHERAARLRRLAVKEVPVEKSQEDNQVALAGKRESVRVRARSGRRAQAEMPIRGSQEDCDQIISAGKEDNQVDLAGKKEGLRGRPRTGRRAQAEMHIQGSQEDYDQTISAGKAPLEGDAHERVKRRRGLSGIKALGWKSGDKYDQIISEKATPQTGVHKKVLRIGGQAGEVSKSVGKVERRGRKDTLNSFKERLMRQKQAVTLKRKASKMSSVSEMGGKSAKVLKLSRPPKNPDQLDTATATLLSDCEKRGLKSLAREIGIRAVLEAGYTIQYKLRKGKLSTDTIYTSPKGHSYWSLPNAWNALAKTERKGQLRVEKAVAQQVLSKIDSDENMRSAFEKLDRFSGTSLQDVMRKANFTYEELTDILLEDLHVLRKEMPSKKKRHPVASESSAVNKRKEKQKKDVQQEVNGRASTSKSSTSLKNFDGGYVPKSEKNRSVLREGKVRMWHKGVKKAPMNKSSSLLKALTEKSRKKSRGSAKSTKIDARTPKQESQKIKEKMEKPRSGFRLEVRPSNLSIDDESEDLSCRSKRTVTSWMIDRGAVLEKERIFYVDQMSNDILKEGVLTREGILCRCCKKVYTVKNFEGHGRSEERTHCKLIFTSGRSFLDCQLEAWNVEVQIRKTHNYKGVTAHDTNDDTCLLCGDGGSLLCCDLCPSTFHASCLQLDNVPEGSWYCPKCRCGVCRDRSDNEEEVSMAVCKQCEHRYHIACLCGGHTIVENDFFCGNLCRKIYSGLSNLVGVTQSLEKGFSWTLIRCTEEGDGPGSTDTDIAIKNNSKLAVALLVLKECFNPMDDPRTNIDMITHATYNRWSQFDRLNYVGFYTAVLERDDEIISVASIRIHGARIAEMPLIGTRHKYRRQGMCRLLVGVIEKLLCSLEVGTFILPAIPELFETWTKAFGFRPLDSLQRSDIKDLSMMVFPGTDLLQKPLPKSSTGNPAMQQICESAAELPRSADAKSLDDCENLCSVGSGRIKDVKTNSPVQVSDPEPLESDDGDDDVFFDACLNLQSTDSSAIAETGTSSLLNLSSQSPICDGSLSAKSLSTSTRGDLEQNSGCLKSRPASSGDGDSVNVEGFLNEMRDDGAQKPDTMFGSSKGLGDADLQKLEQSLVYKQVDGGYNGSLNAEFILQDACDTGFQQSEPTHGTQQVSQEGVDIGLRNQQSSQLNSDSAEPMLSASAMLVCGNSQNPERLESSCGLQISKPSSELIPPASLNAVAPFCKARNCRSLRSVRSTKALGTDPSIPAYIEERGAITQKSEPNPDSALLGSDISVIDEGKLFVHSSDSNLEKQKLVSDPMQNDLTHLREVGLSCTEGSFPESRDVAREPTPEAN